MDSQAIDTVALVRQIRDGYYECLQGKTHQERIAFYCEQTQKMQARVTALFTGQALTAASSIQTSVDDHLVEKPGST